MRSYKISIHAARAGCDRKRPSSRRSRSNFNPRSPRRLRLAGTGRIDREYHFNPRSPRRLRRKWYMMEGDGIEISIHAARANCDDTSAEGTKRKKDFNPRSPRELRPETPQDVQNPKQISIHAARANCDSAACEPLPRKGSEGPKCEWRIQAVEATPKFPA
ncbi:hypothetical protein [Cohnella fermenti]|uniref:hypothetical protein n=1 Tax=Cohnella fermenti TaxID=2565925 RepID=UPI0038B33FC9